MNYKFRTGNIVRVKKTGEKATIREIVGFTHVPAYWIDTDKQQGVYVFETEIKPYCPSRTGTRDPKTGRFVSTIISFKDWQKGNLKSYLNKTATEVSLDSKQRNYQKIEKMDISPLESTWSRPLKEKINEIIDELGRRV